MSSDQLQQQFLVEFAEAFAQLNANFNTYTSQAQYENTKTSVFCPDFAIPVPPTEKNDSLQRQQNLYQDYENAQKFLSTVKDAEARQKIELKASQDRVNFDEKVAREVEQMQAEWEEMCAKKEMAFGIFAGELCDVRSVCADANQEMQPGAEISEHAMEHKQKIVKWVQELRYQPVGTKAHLKNTRLTARDFVQFHSALSTYLCEPVEITGEK